MKKNHPALWKFLFIIYTLCMLFLLFGRSRGHIPGLTYEEQLKLSTNLTPFLTIRNYLHVVFHGSNEALVTHCIVNLVGNVFLFIPAGCFLPMLFDKQRNFLLFFVTCTGIMLSVELIQLLTLLGSFDVDDLILNLSGMTLGYFLYSIFHWVRTRTQGALHDEKDNFL